jgi:hypothetical protein
MTSRQIRFALPVVLALLIVLPSCSKLAVGQPGPFTISLAYNGGQCTQNGSTGVIDVEQDWDVTYQGAAALSEFNVQFSSCPFAAGKCPVNSPQGATQNPGTPTAASVNNTYYYSSVTINGQSCNNGTNTFGVHIKPGTPLKKKK